MTRREKIFWLVIGAVFVVGFVFLIPACNQGYEQGNNAQHQQCAGNKVAFIAIRQIAEFFDVHNWLLTALFAGLVTLFTWRLWQATIELRLSTDGLWDTGEKQRLLAEQTAERQLRAYVSGDGGSLQLVQDNAGRHFIQGHYTFKNFGQTPAYKFRLWVRLDILAADTMEFEHSVSLSESLLGPGAIAENGPVKGPISDADLAAIQAGTKRIFIWGEALYIDAFGHDRYLRFYDVNGRNYESGRKWIISNGNKPYEAN